MDKEGGELSVYICVYINNVRENSNYIPIGLFLIIFLTPNVCIYCFNSIIILSKFQNTFHVSSNSK